MNLLSSKEAMNQSDGYITFIVDLRSISEFAEGHPKDALSIPFSERSLTDRIRTVAPDTEKVIFLAENDEQLSTACIQLENEGTMTPFILDGGYNAWLNDNMPTQSFGEISVSNLTDEIEKNPELLVLDVRESIEWETGHVPNAKLISLSEIPTRYNELPNENPIAVICEGGIRSSTAASILQAKGFYTIFNVPEGSMGYRNGGNTLEFYIDPENE